jgi:hypothetical protein
MTSLQQMCYNFQKEVCFSCNKSSAVSFQLSPEEAGKVFENFVSSYCLKIKPCQLVPVQMLFLSQLAANFLARYDEGVKVILLVVINIFNHI